MEHLIRDYGVKIVKICSLTPRSKCSSSDYNDDVQQVNKLLQHRVSYPVFYHHHKGIWQKSLLLNDGVHFNGKGNFKFMFSLRKAVLHGV